MKMRLLMTMLLAGAMLGGCELSVNDDDDDDSGIAGGFSVEWTVLDFDTEELISCDEAGSDYVQIIVDDSAGERHTYYWDCWDGAGETEWEIATGEASVEANLLSGEYVLSTTNFTHDFESGTLSNEFAPIEFYTYVYDPVASPDASVEWLWGTGTTDDYEYLADDDCIDAGIDYAYLWVWNPYTESWWGDSTWSEFPCGAYDHGDGYDPWSGLHAEDLLEAGDYQFYLGFYQANVEYDDYGNTTEMLMYYDTRGTSSDPWPIEADADEYDYNDMGVTLINPEEEEFGILKINLVWHETDGSAAADCADSSVAVMGFLLRNDGWVAAEVPLDAGLECLDWLVFEDVPVLSDAYELLVSGADAEDYILWYNLCTGLDPQTGVSVDDAEGYTCTIANLLEP